MRIVTLAIILACILTLSLGGGVFAMPPVGTSPPPGSTFQDEWLVCYAEDEYLHWGPAIYYGQPVWVHYEEIAHDFFIAKKNYYHYTIQGSARVYSDEGLVNLIDERPFSAIIKFKDSQNTKGWIWHPRVWPGYFWGYVESFYMNWVIPGVYDATAKCKDGHWTATIVVHTAPPIRSGTFPDEPPHKGYFPPP